jgi:hypothetical protein
MIGESSAGIAAGAEAPALTISSRKGTRLEPIVRAGSSRGKSTALAVSATGNVAQGYQFAQGGCWI